MLCLVRESKKRQHDPFTEREFDISRMPNGTYGGFGRSVNVKVGGKLGSPICFLPKNCLSLRRFIIGAFPKQGNVLTAVENMFTDG